MKVLVCPGSFKGSLGAVEACRIISAEFIKYFSTIELPLADGGDGTLEAVKYFSGGNTKIVGTFDPFGKHIETEFLMLDKKTALIELALSSGLKLVDPTLKPALFGSTYGTGVVIKKALEAGAEKIYLCAGGSATADGGTGIMEALGVGFFDSRGEKIKSSGANLIRLRRIDTSHIYPCALKAEFVILCDVKNPLLGKKGGVEVFSRQKGATDEDVEFLKKSFKNFRQVLLKKTGKDAGKMKHGGAAGGVPSLMKVLFDSRTVSGSEYVASLASFEKRLSECFLAVTGEGKVDATSGSGKITGFVAKKASACGINVLTLTGWAEARLKGSQVISILPGPMNLDEALKSAEKNLARTAGEMAEIVFEIVKKGRVKCLKT